MNALNILQIRVISYNCHKYIVNLNKISSPMANYCKLWVISNNNSDDLQIIAVKKIKINERSSLMAFYCKL